MLAPLRRSLSDAVLIGARMPNGTQPADINDAFTHGGLIP